MLTPGSFIAPGPIANYSAKSALFTISAADRSTFFDNTGTYSITLPAASTVGAGFNWYSRNVSGAQTFAPAGANTINSATTYVSSNAGDVITGISTGTAWVVQHTQRPSTVAITGGTIASLTSFDVTGAATFGNQVTVTESASTQAVTAIYTGAQASNGGAIVAVSANDGSAMGSGNRMGSFQFKGIRTGSTFTFSASIDALATEAWSSTASGTKLVFTTTPNGSTTRATAVTIDQDKSVTIAAVTASTSTTTGALIVSGGLGVAGKGYFGDDVTLSAAKNLNLASDGGVNIGGGGANGYFISAILAGPSSGGMNVRCGNNSSSLTLSGNNGTAHVTINNAGSTIIGTGAIATNATDGFLYIPSCAGAPSGTPTTATGRIPLVYDSTNNFLYVYNGGWKKSTVYA